VVGVTKDAPSAVWPVAGGNRRVWNEAAAAAAGSDVCESQETAGGLELSSQRWVIEKIFTKTAAALIQTDAASSESTHILKLRIVFLLKSTLSLSVWAHYPAPERSKRRTVSILPGCVRGVFFNISLHITVLSNQ